MKASKCILIVVLGMIAVLSLFDCSRKTDCCGIDISHYNSIKNWEELSKHIDFILIKATEGQSMVDEKYSVSKANAKKYHIPFGAYHVFSAFSSIENQFENYKKIVGKDIDIIPILDVEATGKNKKLGSELTKGIQKFCKMCKEYYGVYPIIYTSEDVFHKYIKHKVDYSLYWCGNVNSKKAIKCDILQKTIKKVPGASGIVDFDVLYCDFEDLKY